MTDQPLTCPCGDFAPGDPSYEHSVRHTPWLRAAEHRSLLDLDRALRGSAPRADRRVEFRDNEDTTSVYIGEQRVLRIAHADPHHRHVVNALVDVLEALGIHPTTA